MLLANVATIAPVTTLYVPNIGQVGAGASVEYLPFVEHVRITLPANAKRADKLIVAHACGDSMRDDGILDGDRIVCKLNFTKSEVRNGRLVIASLPCGGLALKHFHLLKRDDRLCVILRSANPDYEDKCFDFGTVQVKAIVLESIRSWS